jgi:hypothetical protein
MTTAGKLLAAATLCCMLPAHAAAQRTAKVCGKAVYRAPENVSPEQAKRTALERAKLQALADEFGTITSAHNLTTLRNENGKSGASLLMLGGTEVRGEWIEDLQPPAISVAYEQDMLVVTAAVCGRAREVVGAGVEFSAKALRNGTDARFESNDFRHNDDLYLLFRSPAAGYLAVYLIDDAQSQSAFCLLPYRGDPSGQARVKAGKEYVFFSDRHAERGTDFVEGYTLTCEKAMEQNLLYVIFSPNEFTKASDADNAEASSERPENGRILPRVLPYEDFLRWLTKNRDKDKDMKVEVKAVTIRK